MNRFVKKAVLWVFLTLLTAFAVSQGILYTAPYVIMKIARDKLYANQGTNTILHAPLVTHESRKVVRPSPDLIYSICGFDLTEGPLQISAKILKDNYWSVSAYGDNTDNFWVLNDQQIEKDQVTAYIALEEQMDTLPLKTETISVVAPSVTGVILFRNLVATQQDFERVDKVRQQSSCRIHVNERN